jgi:phenylpyruvate tautomerase PptA (4-oxalocrotonate tautomerase family)
MTCCVFAASSMPSCGALPACQYYLRQARRAMPQLNLNFTDIPIPETCLWEQLDADQKRIVIETLTRLLVKATGDKHQEQTNDD